MSINTKYNLEHLQFANNLLPTDYKKKLGNLLINYWKTHSPPNAVEDEMQKDFAEMILQYGTFRRDQHLIALTKVISRIYKKQTNKLPPLPIWKEKCDRIYTIFKGDLPGIFVIPSRYQKHQGIMGWAAVAHEAVGQAFLQTNLSLMEEFIKEIDKKFKKELINEKITDYFKTNLESILKDIVGFCHLGPGMKAIFCPGNTTIRVENFPLSDSFRILIAHEVLKHLPILEEPKLPKVSKEVSLEEKESFPGKEIPEVPEQILLGKNNFPASDVQKALEYLLEEFFPVTNDIQSEQQSTNSMQIASKISKIIEPITWNVIKENELHHLIAALKNNKISSIRQYQTQTLISAAVVATLENVENSEKIFNQMIALIQRPPQPKHAQ